MEKEIDFSKYSSIRIGGVKRVKIVEKITPLPKDSFIVGGCNNLLISPNSPPFIMLSKNFDFISLKDDKLHVGAATKSGKILSFAKKHNLADFELLQKLPGTVGGMVKMNAGLKEWEIFNHLDKIKTSKGWIEKKDIDFGYRYANIDDIIYEVVFSVKGGFSFEKLSYFKNLRDNQPQTPSCGSCFKNPKDHFAGKLIEDVGLKGILKGDMCFSPKHANFLVNQKNGKFDDAIFLIHEAKRRVYEEFGIKLEEEIVIV